MTKEPNTREEELKEALNGTLPVIDDAAQHARDESKVNTAWERVAKAYEEQAKHIQKLLLK